MEQSIDWESLPLETTINYLSRLNYDDLENICRTDKSFNKLCKDPNFWKSLIYARFGKRNISDNENPQRYYQSLITRFNTTITWIAPDPSTDSDAAFTIDENNITVDRAMIILDAFEAVVYPGSDRSIIIENSTKVYSISTNFNGDTNTTDSYAREILVKINELREALGLPSNMTTYLISRQDEIERKLKIDILSRNNRVIQLSNSYVAQDFPLKIIEFIGSKERMTEFLGFIVPLYQYGWVEITQTIIHNGRQTILSRGYFINWSFSGGKYQLQEQSLNVYDLNFNKIRLLDISELWNISF